jgi:hypothetical protein
VTKRDRTVVGVILGVALLAAFWFLLLAPKRKSVAALDKQIVAQEQRLTAAQAKAGAAQNAKQRYRADYAAVARLGQAVPADDDVPSLVYQIDQAADRADIDFRKLSVSAADGNTGAPASPAAPAAPPAPAPDAGGGAAAQAAPPASTPAPATQSAAATLPPGASVGSAGFPTMPFSFAFEGSFFSMQKFLGRLDDFTKVDGSAVDVRGRLLAVDSFELAAGRDGFPQVAATIKATAYVLPAGEGLTGGATASGPAPAAGGESAPGAPPAAAITGDGR